ncbi:MAG: selenocysteine-specific translation elongation factor [Burkholderiales bacterium]|nr:selenocysteine-specific translation elongation factor [Burkholderiales bacterium]
MIVATAGHIDHGKTLLVKALTGVDTDRLPEEKARGISIDLGFAYLPLEAGGLIGFVDVPGHERFIRNMLAGVCGIDYALLVVAADDGVMPQTVEHLNILDLLGVREGMAVVTKIDRVAPERVREVERDVAALVAGTALEGIAVAPVSAVTRAGIDGLRERLVATAAARAARATQGQHFRFAIDRAFSVAGSGTVVTGTVFNGAVALADRLVISPKGAPVRVRGIQIRGIAAERAEAGERCALNLAGSDLETVARGDWVLSEAIHAPTQRLDARVTLLEGEPLEHWTPLHLHLATADVTARIAIARGAAIEPGAPAQAQLVLDKPVGALCGDRFILRDQSARRTLGGGVVLDPFAPATRRASRARRAELAALELGSMEAALGAMLDAGEDGVDLARLERIFNVTPARAQEIQAAAGITVLGKERRVALRRERYAALREAAIAALREFHRGQPQALGIEVEALRGQIAPRLGAEAFQSLLRGLADERKLELSGSTARLPGHNATSNPEDEKLWQAVLPALAAGGASPPAVPELAAALKLKEATLKDFLHRKSRSGDPLRVPPDRFYPRATLAALAATAAEVAKANANGMFTAAQYRDATGTGRGLAIQLLEFFDSLGVTQRLGDARKMRRDPASVLGAAAPFKAAGKPAAGAPGGKTGPQQPGRPGPRPPRPNRY